MTKSQKTVIGVLFVAFLFPIVLLVLGLNSWDDTNDNTLRNLESKLLPVLIKYDSNYFEAKIMGNFDDGVQVMFEHPSNSSSIDFLFPNTCFEVGASADMDFKSQFSSFKKVSMGENGWLRTIDQVEESLVERSFRRDKQDWIKETYELNKRNNPDFQGEFILGGVVPELGAKKNHLVEGKVSTYNLRGCVFGVITTYPKIIDENTMNVFMKRQADIFYFLESKI